MFEVIITSKRIFCSVKCSSKSKKGKFSGEKNPSKRPEVRIKISKALSGKSKSKEHIEHLKKSSIEAYKNGRKNPFSGKHHSEISKQKTRKTIESRGGRKKENNGNWQGGISLLPYPFDFDKDIKEFIRGRDNNTCQLCGKTGEQEKEQNGRKLCPHHINYDKDDLFELNLITLCDSCNGKVNFRRDFWEGYFTFKLLHGIILKSQTAR